MQDFDAFANILSCSVGQLTHKFFSKGCDDNWRGRIIWTNDARAVEKTARKYFLIMALLWSSCNFPIGSEWFLKNCPVVISMKNHSASALGRERTTQCLTATFRLSKTSQIGPFFGNFNELLSIQNVNIARFARNVDETFLWLSNTV